MDWDVMDAELAAAADGDLPYDTRDGCYWSAWMDADRADRERMDAVAPKLGRCLDQYTDELAALNDTADRVAGRAAPLAWGFDDVAEHDAYRVALTRHPARDRTVIYDPLPRFVERFADGICEAIGPDALRNRILGKSLGRGWTHQYAVRRWDEEQDGWHEVLWAWTRAEDIDDMAAAYMEHTDAAADAAATVRDYRSRPHITTRLD